MFICHPSDVSMTPAGHPCGISFVSALPGERQATDKIRNYHDSSRTAECLLHYISDVSALPGQRQIENIH